MRHSLRTALALALTAALACDRAPDAVPEAMPATVAAGDSTSAPADVFTDRVAVFLLADSTHLERMREQYGADAEVVFDDMMWYRAEAWDWIERHGIPIVSIDGRRPLRFRVGGEERSFDYAGEAGGDLVVLYDTDRAPVAVPTIEVAERTTAYFPGLAPPNAP